MEFQMFPASDTYTDSDRKFLSHLRALMIYATIRPPKGCTNAARYSDRVVRHLKVLKDMPQTALTSGEAFRRLEFTILKRLNQIADAIQANRTS